jgi:hypothetical protein
LVRFGPEIPVKREEGWVCLTATGLNLIGRVGHELFMNHGTGWREYADKLADLDWRKTADIWQGNIIQGTKVMTQQGLLHKAFDAIRGEIGLSTKNNVDMFAAK